ncbi:uncharacterized protein L201_007610 [Kwoniella dendrophila CBS 6074]|uniref:TNFR-Cys domain-containing protein n=1 Tax=Kwoniella dendrophila CBS 6074 TaxID=1295534 RepID=A0AAX4K4J6_9TREE
MISSYSRQDIDDGEDTIPEFSRTADYIGSRTSAIANPLGRYNMQRQINKQQKDASRCGVTYERSNEMEKCTGQSCGWSSPYCKNRVGHPSTSYCTKRCDKHVCKDCSEVLHKSKVQVENDNYNRVSEGGYVLATADGDDDEDYGVIIA